ncbi:MAG: putative small protein [Phormidium sp. OSCR]|nr:MAG: putative small protein [Phormidium sp. OSCR]
MLACYTTGEWIFISSQIAMQLSIPDSVVQAMRLPEPRREAELLKELALTLYEQEILSSGKACELAKQDFYQFSQLLGDRKLLRHYSETEMAEDLDYARHQ